MAFTGWANSGPLLYAHWVVKAVANAYIIFERKIVHIYSLSGLTCVLGAQKNRLIETVLLSTHNVCLR